MSNATDDSLIDQYNTLSRLWTKYVGLLLYVICLFGTVMNVVTFLQRTLNRRTCSLYLLVASVCDFMHLNLGPLSNILQYAFYYDWTINSLTFCKAKSYFVFMLLIISGTLTTLASADRYMLSSEKSSRWNYSRRSVGIRFIQWTIISWIIISTPILFCSQRYHHVSRNEQLICSNPARHMGCYLVQWIYICILNGFLPPLVMLIFGRLTHLNVRDLHRRVQRKSVRIERINRQLTSMLIVQAIKSTIASIPFSLFHCYWLLTLDRQKTFLSQARENLIHQLVYLLYWSNYTSFFVYLYSSETFRHHWIKAMKQVLFCFVNRREHYFHST